MNRREQLTADYRLAREAQDQRFEAAVQGRDRSDTNTPEYREYFGLGEYEGGGVEKRITYRDFIVANAAENREPAREPAGVARLSPAEDITMDQAFYLTGADLDQLIHAGSATAVAERDRRAVKRAAKRAARGAA